jgi:hypothetical protein
MSWLASLKPIPADVVSKFSGAANSQKQEFVKFMMNQSNPKVAEMMKRQQALFSEPAAAHQFTTKNGWHVLVVERFDVITEAADVLRKLSIGSEVVASFVEEHVMVSAAVEWKDGKEVWFVQHDSQKGRMNLEERGTLPPSYTKIKSDLSHKAQGPGPDYLFDVPVELAASITGFRYDSAEVIP